MWASMTVVWIHVAEDCEEENEKPRVKAVPFVRLFTMAQYELRRR